MKTIIPLLYPSSFFDHDTGAAMSIGDLLASGLPRLNAGRTARQLITGGDQ